jgi:putative transcriptional regulator
MITHHPKHELLELHVKGQLPASISAAISMHAEMCPLCQDMLEELTLSQSSTIFESAKNSTVDTADEFDMDFSSMIDSITSSEQIYVEKPITPRTVNLRGHEYVIPRAIDKVAQSQWQNLGKLSRARLDLNEGELHTSLLHIDPTGAVPAHTHKGFELTLLLDGSFEDELGAYTKGDFIWLTKSHTHKPETKDGCLCYTVSSNALQFTKGLARILNPIGNFIY